MFIMIAAKSQFLGSIHPPSASTLRRGTARRQMGAKRNFGIRAKYTVRVPNGVYMRCDEASELKNYAKMLSLLKLSSLASYTASKLIEGVAVSVDETRTKATVKYLTVVPFFDVEETFALDGMTRTKNKRRDLEDGLSTCTATLTNDMPDGSSDGENLVLRMKMSWEEPNKGGLLEEMHVAKNGELIVRSTVQVRDGTASCRLVYKKVQDGQYRSSFRWNPLEAVRLLRNGAV
jgi:hypothetical protein